MTALGVEILARFAHAFALLPDLEQYKPHEADAIMRKVDEQLAGWRAAGPRPGTRPAVQSSTGAPLNLKPAEPVESADGDPTRAG